MWTPIDTQDDLHTLDASVVWDDARLLEFYASPFILEGLPTDISRSGFHELTLHVLLDAAGVLPDGLELALIHCDVLILDRFSPSCFRLRGSLDALRRVELEDSAGRTLVRCARLAYRRFHLDEAEFPYFPSRFSPPGEDDT